MNDFLLYHNLCNLYSQVEPYAGGHELFSELKNLVDQFSSKTYRVAVIGEFKRGKSSLVNALLGTEILPTDILPTTAVINRIIYSLEQKIVIHFKNGETKESTIDSLAEYATKLDKEKEEFAETIREIVVHYPSVFGQNHIELIDTPGLNDSESMTETTLNVLGDIDTAIVVISATMPLSMTEQNLICDLIKQTDIYNLVFAVTFIDRVSDEEDEQDRIVELIKNRLSQDTYRHFCESVEDEKLVEKADRILSQPNVYAVSSRQAIQGFIKGRNDLIEKSRFKHFKYNLSALLTANQEKDRLLKIQRICSALKEQIPEWIEQYFQHIETDIQTEEKRFAVFHELYSSSQAYLNEKLLRLEADAKNKRDAVISDFTNTEDINKHLIRFFVKHLSSLRRSEFCEATLRNAIQQSCTEANAFMNTVIDKISVEVEALSKTTYREVEARYEAVLHELNVVPSINHHLTEEKNSIPVFVLSENHILGKMTNMFDECMPYVSKTVEAALAHFYDDFENFLALHRILIIGYNKEVRAILKDAIDRSNNKIDSEKKKLLNEKNVAEIEQSQIATTILKIEGITD